MADSGDSDDPWEGVSHWRERLKDSEDFPVLNCLESTWRLLDKSYDGIVKREDDGTTADTPLAALFYYVEMGFYPPPEILLALSEAFDHYRAAAGSLSLEEVFLGRPKRKGGNYARRKNSLLRKMMLAYEMTKLLKAGHSKMAAAEILSERMGGKPEPESIMRTVHPFTVRNQRNK